MQICNIIISSHILSCIQTMPNFKKLQTIAIACFSCGKHENEFSATFFSALERDSSFLRFTRKFHEKKAQNNKTYCLICNCDYNDLYTE